MLDIPVPAEKSDHLPAPGAERWDLQSARTAFAVNGIPAPGDNGARYSVVTDRLRIRVLCDQGGTLPRAGTAAREKWNGALDRIAAALAGATSFTDVRRTCQQAPAQAVVPRTPRTTARMRRGGVPGAFGRAVRFDNHPSHTVGGMLTLAAGGPPAWFWFVTDTDTDTNTDKNEAGRTFGDHQAAVELFGHHYDLPMPLALVDEGRSR